MPILEFEMSNAGVLKHVKCTDVPKLMIITGPNGVGKSTLLEEIVTFLQGKRKGNISVKMSNSPKPVYLPPHRTPARGNLPKSLPLINPHRRYRDTLGLEHFSINDIGLGLPDILRSMSARSRLDPDATPYFEVKYRLTQLEQEFKDTVAEVYRKRKEVPHDYMPDIHKPLKDAVKHLLPGLEFDRIIVEGNTYKIYFKNRTGASVEFDYLSSGEKDLLALIFPFVEKLVEKNLAVAKGESVSAENLVFLIDGPEAYLHPELQRRFLKYARNLIKNTEEKLQFLIATHSTTIINEAKSEELYVLLFPDQVEDNQLNRVSSEADKLYVIRDILGDIGLAALSAGKPILILEGKMDVEILELLIPNVRDSYILRSLGGKGRVLSFIKALETAIPEFLARGFKIFAILDKDSGGIVKNEKGIVFTWSVACIENFLLADYEVLHKTLEVVAGKDKLLSLNVKSQKEVEKLVMEIIKDPETIEDLVKSTGRSMKIAYDEIKGLTDEEKKGRILKAFESWKERLERKRKEIKTITNDAERALKELDGKVILHAIAKRTSTKSEPLARSLANRMSEMERVPTEVTNLVNSIEKLCKKKTRLRVNT